MLPKALARAAVVAALAMFAGCESEKSNVEKGRAPEVPALAPGGAGGGQDAQRVDRGTTGAPADKAP